MNGKKKFGSPSFDKTSKSFQCNQAGFLEVSKKNDVSNKSEKKNRLKEIECDL